MSIFWKDATPELEPDGFFPSSPVRPDSKFVRSGPAGPIPTLCDTTDFLEKMVYDLNGLKDGFSKETETQLKLIRFGFF
jgi:hypothetical protein